MFSMNATTTAQKPTAPRKAAAQRNTVMTNEKSPTIRKTVG